MATSVFALAARGRWEEVRAAVAAGRASVRSRDAYGRTLLHFAAGEPECGEGDGGTVSFLLAAGAEPEARTHQGATPLLWAASGGTAAIVEALLAGGADPTGADPEGRTPLVCHAVFPLLRLTTLCTAPLQPATIERDGGASAWPNNCREGTGSGVLAVCTARQTLIRSCLFVSVWVGSLSEGPRGLLPRTLPARGCALIACECGPMPAFSGLAWGKVICYSCSVMPFRLTPAALCTLPQLDLARDERPVGDAVARAMVLVGHPRVELEARVGGLTAAQWAERTGKGAVADAIAQEVRCTYAVGSMVARQLAPRRAVLPAVNRTQPPNTTTTAKPQFPMRLQVSRTRAPRPPRQIVARGRWTPARRAWVLCVVASPGVCAARAGATDGPPSALYA
jgi:hypothetical protein